ncbi:hypothetical protein H0H93_005036, partial [Arthromyces matolae]
LSIPSREQSSTNSNSNSNSAIAALRSTLSLLSDAKMSLVQFQLQTSAPLGTGEGRPHLSFPTM